MEDERSGFDIEFVNSAGEMVIVSVDYPKDRAILALQALRESTYEGHWEQIIRAHRDDPSIASALEEEGIDLD